MLGTRELQQPHRMEDCVYGLTNGRDVIDEWAAAQLALELFDQLTGRITREN
jgi:hypothetical protein